MNKFDKISEDLSILIDKLNLFYLIVILISVITISSFSFYFLTLNGIVSIDTNDPNKLITLLDSFYFSIVTISTLGYGDYSPVGIGKIISVIEVLLGVILIALIVSKLSSERQIRLIKILYASDSDKELKKFIGIINNYTSDLDNALRNHDQEKILVLVKGIFKFSGIISSYFKFHTNYGILLNFSNKVSIRKTTRGITNLSIICIKTAKLTDTNDKIVRTIGIILRRIEKYSADIKNHTNDEITKGICSHIITLIRSYDNYLQNKKINPSKSIPSHISIITDNLLNRIESEMPKDVWVKGLHKTIAIKIGISNKLAHKCITKLLEDKRISKP